MPPQRLPIVNSDDGVWGDILRQYLEKEHYNDDTDNAVNGGHKTITIRPGTAAAGTAPLKFSSGTLMSTPEAGAVEFNTDSLYLTTTTGTVRKKVAIYDDSSGATGDIYYRDSSSNLVPLPIGSDGKTLQVVGGVPAWDDVDMTGKVSKSGDTMSGALTIGVNSTALSLGDGTNASVSSNIQGTRAYVGYDANGYAVLQGGASKGLRLNVNSSTFGVGTAVEIDTAGQLKMANATTASTGILLGTDVNLYRSAANTLRTDDSIVMPGLDSLSIANLTNTSYIMSASAAGSYASFSPVPKYLWHDMLTYQLWWGTPTHETYNGTWNSATLNKALFANKENQVITVINGTTNTAARWTWNSSTIATAYANWWVLGIAYHGVTPSSKDILIESSTDGTNWTTRHTSTANTAHFTPVWLYVTDWASATYIRLTITVTNSQPLTMSTIKALSGRWGNQGGGSENNLPYTWDSDGRITIGTGTGGIAGTTNYSNGALNVGLSTATTAAQGIFFGTDTNLYRSAANTLKTDDNFEGAAQIYAQGNLVVGTGSASTNISLRGSSFNGITTDIYSDTASAYSYFRRTRGTIGSPTVVTNNSFLGSFGFRGYADAGMINQDSARISGYATQDFGTTHGGAIAFYTAANGTSVASGSSQRLTIYHDGNIGIGVTVPTFKLQLAAGTTAAAGIGFGSDTNLYRSAANVLQTDDAFVIGSDRLNIATTKTPASAAAAGTTGDIAWDGDYIYVCVATNTWKRTNLTSW